MRRYIQETGGPYGRSFNRRALEVSGVVEETRDLLAEMLGISVLRSISSGCGMALEVSGDDAMTVRDLLSEAGILHDVRDRDTITMKESNT